MKETKTISWQVLQAGQIRPYADSIYEYEVKTEIHENQVKEFCFNFLKRVSPKNKGHDFSGSCNFPYGMNSYYTFRKKEENTYMYKVCCPYTG